MKVVVDTNVFISAVWRDRNPETVILWILNQPNCEWLISPEIMEEYEEVLHRPKFSFSPDTLNKWETLLNRDTHPVRVDEQIDFPRDQKDAKFIACALANDADYLITGDSDFSEARRIANVAILSISQFKRFIVDKK